MSAAILVSRDSESFRIELQDVGDADVLRLFGPYRLIQKGNCISCFPDPEGTKLIGLGYGRLGLRFFDVPGISWNENSDLKYGRFGPISLEADVYNGQGFEIELPPLYQRPWPKLCENDSYDIGEQVMITLTERINDEIDFSGMSTIDAMKLQLRKLPDQLRRHLPYGLGEPLITEWMSKVRGQMQ